MNARRSILVVALTGTVLLAACSDDNGDSAAPTTTAAATTTAPAPDDTAGSTDTSGAPAAGGMTIAVATVDTYGDVLVDGNGRSLYLFDKDQGTTSACTGGCLDNWPPVSSADGLTAGDGIDASLLTDENGQAAYNGHLLYYFAGDLQPGDVNGAGIPAWYLVTPAGDAAEQD